MWGFIKWTLMWALILSVGLVSVTWWQLSAQERAQWKRDLLLAIDEGDTKPLRCTVQHDAGHCAKRLLRQFVLWLLGDVQDDKKQAPPSEEQINSGGLFPNSPKKGQIFAAGITA